MILKYNKQAAAPENRRPLALGVTVAVLESVTLSTGHRQAGDSNRVAAKKGFKDRGVVLTTVVSSYLRHPAVTVWDEDQEDCG